VALNADLQSLIRLQQARDRINTLTQRIEIEIPSRVAELETELTTVRQRLEEEQAGMDAARKERSRLELELKSVEEKIAKYKVALMQVRTNDEYRAALNEIDYMTRAHSDLETRILELMESNEARRDVLKGLEEEFKTEDQKIQSDRKVFEHERGQLITERRAEEEAADAIAATLPEPLRRLYDRISSVRSGYVLAEARSGMCLACNMRLRPAIFQQVRRNEAVVTCDSCRRILYYSETEEASAAEEGVAPVASSEGTGPGLH
jgi:predicted  nucleic acid-binding Zn-ribbon protein